MDYEDYDDLEEHIVQDHDGCHICLDIFSNSDDLDAHLVEKHFYCTSCRISHKTQARLNEHRVNSHHWCIPCGRAFQNANNLRQHQNSSLHAPKTVTCPMIKCYAKFVSLSALISHAEAGKCLSGITRRQIDRMAAQGDINGVVTDRKLIGGTDASGRKTYTFDTETHYQANERAWNGQAYECYLCHKAFRQLRDLNAHLNSPAHTGAKIYRCSPTHGCGTRFTTLSALMRHIEDDAKSCGVKRFRFVARAIEDTVKQLSKSITY